MCCGPFCNQTWYGVVHDHKLDCHVKTLGCCLEGQGHSEGLYNQNMTVSTVQYKIILLFIINA